MSASSAALVSIFAKVGLQRANPDLAQFVRTATVLVATGLLVALSGRFKELADWKLATWVFTALSGLATAVSWVCYFRALEMGEVSKVASVDKLSVVLVAILALAVLKEPITGISWIGIALVPCGVIILGVWQ